MYISPKKILDDPDAERKAIADAFASIGVLPSHLKDYLGCALDQIAPAELVGVREMFTAIRDGHVTWRELIADRKTAQEQAGTASGAEPPILASRTAALKDRLRKSSEVTGTVPASEAGAGNSDGDAPRGAETTSDVSAPSTGQDSDITTRTSKGELGGEPSTVLADPSGQTGQAGTAEASSKATGSPAPELPAHIALLEGYRAKVGDKRFYAILAKARRAYPDGFTIGHWRTEVPPDIAEQIIFDLEDEIKAQAEARGRKKS